VSVDISWLGFSNTIKNIGTIQQSADIEASALLDHVCGTLYCCPSSWQDNR